MEEKVGAKIGRLRWLLRMVVVGIGIALGCAVGLGFYTFKYARGSSYLTNDPKACINCHIMNEQYEGWLKGSHRSVATCNDCHAPHDLVGKYMTKATNGFWHSFAFTTGKFHEPIRIKLRNQQVTEATCRHCHSAVVDAIDGPHQTSGKVSCLHCHRSVGHPH
jgi:cytochrome c nitrite reductase small subunit